jgi:hypothetical protein
MEKSVGIKTTGADTYIATFKAAEEADGRERLIQIISLSSGKISETLGAAPRSVAADDSLDVSGITADFVVGDNAYFACYLKHSEPNGYCLITPLLCDNEGHVIGCLETKASQVKLPILDGSDYLSTCLSWPILETGAWKIYAHVTDLSVSNIVDVWCFTF